MSKATTYVEVAPAVPLKPSALPVYTYHLPAELGRARSEADLRLRPVIVPWRGRRVRGVILRIRRRPVPFPTRPVINLGTHRLTPGQLRLASWIAAAAHGGLGYTLRLFLPPGR